MATHEVGHRGKLGPVRPSESKRSKHQPFHQVFLNEVHQPTCGDLWVEKKCEQLPVACWGYTSRFLPPPIL